MLRRGLSLLAALVIIGALGFAARSVLGVELDAASIQARVQSFGWWGPLVFVVMLMFRHFLMLPSTVLLTVGGLCFGTLWGGLLGGIGMTISGVVIFGLLRNVKTGRFTRWAEAGGSAVGRAIERGAPAAIALATAIPPTPFTAFHCAAAFTGMHFPTFLLSSGLGAFVRAFGLAYFGAGLLEDPTRLVSGVAVLAVLIVGPLLVPGVRRKLLPPSEPQDEPRAGSA